MAIKLPTNGLTIPDDFPAAPYSEIHRLVVRGWAQHAYYEHHAGAWNAMAYRYRALVDHGDAFIASLDKFGTAPEPEQRYAQEHALFGFFSCAFATFEAAFYGLYAIGTFLAPSAFPLATARDQQLVTPKRTKDGYVGAFPNDVLVGVIDQTLVDPEFRNWREVRNILTHRSAPGRRMFVGIGDDDIPPDEWKLNKLPLDASLITTNRKASARLLQSLLTATATFVAARLPN